MSNVYEGHNLRPPTLAGLRGARELLNKLYIDSRYPGEFGLLPTGAPTVDEAREFALFAHETMRITTEILAGQGKPGR